MKRSAVLLGIFLLLPPVAEASFFDDDAPNPCVAGAGATFEPVFSSGTALSPSIVKEIASAKKSIRVAAHDFNSKPVAEALIAASRAKIDVQLMLDKKEAASVYSGAMLMKAMSIFPHVTKEGKTLVSDYIIIDEGDIILGNIAGLTDEEDEKKSSGSVMIIRNAPVDVTKRYLADWQKLWDASDAMTPDKN